MTGPGSAIMKVMITGGAGIYMTYFVMECWVVVEREFLDIVLPIPQGYPKYCAFGAH